MKIDWQKAASVGICLTIISFVLFIAGKYLFGAFMPFLLAWLMAMFTSSVASFICKKINISKKLCRAAVLVLLLLLIALLLFLGINRAMAEIQKLIAKIADGSTLSSIMSKLEELESKPPFSRLSRDSEELNGLKQRLDEMLTSFLKGLAADIATALTSIAASSLRSLPSILLFVFITIIASFYFALDLEKITDYIAKILPKVIKNKLPSMKKHTRSLAAKYLKAYSILLVLTFFELLIGFLILGTDYVFLPSLCIAVLDILPIFGVGTVLIPWAIICFLTHDFALGIGLVVLWAAMGIIRQIIEPKILGVTIGLHPIAALIGMYVGLKLFGLIGVLLAPALLIAAKAVIVPNNNY